MPLDVVGTRRAVGESSERGTGHYRVPSLRGVGDRTPLFSDGSVAHLEDLLDPKRRAPGHRFGLAISEEERAALLAFLYTL